MDGAFKNDSSLENITLKAGAYILKIYDKAFMNTSIKNVVFSENTLTIGADAFNGDVELTSITLNERLRTIGEGAFNGCNNLSGKLVIPSTVTKIGYDMYSSGAFADTSITSVELRMEVKVLLLMVAHLKIVRCLRVYHYLTEL